MYPDPITPAVSEPVDGRPDSLKRGFFGRHRKVISFVSLIVFLAGGYWLGQEIQNARLAAQRSSARCSLKGLSLAFHNIAAEDGRLPPRDVLADDGTPLYSWTVPMLPYLGYTDISDRLEPGQAWNHLDNRENFQKPVGTMTGCGREPRFDADGYPVAFYSVNSRLLGETEGLALEEITDGLANTLMIGEISEDQPPWGKPGNVRDPALGLKKGPRTFGGPFQGITQFAFSDGSIRSLSDDIDPAVLKALATPAAGDDAAGFH